VPHINEDWLNALLDDTRTVDMDPMMKVRLLLAGMVALNQQQPNGQSNSSSSDPARGGLQEALARLQVAAAKDANEWVKVTAAAAGQLDGRLDLAAVMRQSAVVSFVLVVMWSLCIPTTVPAAAAAAASGSCQICTTFSCFACRQQRLCGTVCSRSLVLASPAHIHLQQHV
jgi:hypothetical protein